MFNAKIAVRNIALAGTVTFLLGSPAVMAQGRGNTRTTAQGWANRVVEGTVRSVAPDRDGEHVRLTNGMDLLVPRSLTRMRQGRRYTASLQPGDLVRANVYSREGDGRDAEVRSFEILQTSGYNNNNQRLNGQRLNGTVVSVNRRSNLMVMRTDNGRTLNVDLGTYNGRGTTSARTFRSGDRITVTGRVDRGTVIADDVSLINTRR
jgi:hypothetical protein